jgi:hypothetical protein
MILNLLPSTHTQHSQGWLRHPSLKILILIASVLRDNIGKPQAEVPTKYSSILSMAENRSRLSRWQPEKVTIWMTFYAASNIGSYC